VTRLTEVWWGGTLGAAAGMGLHGLFMRFSSVLLLREVCVCVCERERERDRERGAESEYEDIERERERGV
jgi:hypothetical protein